MIADRPHASSGSDSRPPWVGRPLRRREDGTLLMGAGRFVDDLRPPGLLHVALVRTPHAHARIVHVVTEQAQRAPGVVVVVTGRELEGVGTMPINRPFPEMVLPPHPLLALDVVRAQGVPIAAVVATSAVAATDAAELVSVDYEPLPGVADPEAALASDAPPIVPGQPHNRSFVHRWRQGHCDAAFDGAARVVTLAVRQQRLAGVPLEPRGVLASWDTQAEQLTVWTSTQAPSRIRSELARMLSLDESRVRVIAPEVGGGFGVKGGPYREEVLVAWLARRLGQPIKWVSTRAEDLLSTHHGRGASSEASLALDVDGRIRGLSARIVCPLGSSLAYTVTATPRNHWRCLPGAYAVASADITLTGVFTTTPPVGAYRGAGRPEAAFLIERLIDTAARELQMDPVELRRRNLIGPDQFPFRTVTGQSYDSGDYPALLARALEVADYAGLRQEQARRRAEGEIVGVGLAVYVEPCAPGWESGLVRMEPSGAVTAVTGSSPHGQGHETTFAQILADQLGVAPERIAIRHGDTLGAPPGMGTSGSRSVVLGGGALVLAATEVREKGRRLAAWALEAAPADVRLGQGGFHVVGALDRFVSWARVAEIAYRPVSLPPGEEPGLEATRFFKPEEEVWSSGAVVVSVRVDPDTGVVTPERLVWVDDAGTIVNPLLADGQLHGSLAQAWGQVFLEAMVLDGSGHVLTGTLMDYGVPHAGDVPEVVIEHMYTPSPRSPIGAKGLGEAGTIGIPPAVVNAVVDALTPYGIRHLDMPIRPETIWRTIHDGARPG